MRLTGLKGQGCREVESWGVNVWCEAEGVGSRVRVLEASGASRRNFLPRSMGTGARSVWSQGRSRQHCQGDMGFAGRSPLRATITPHPTGLTHQWHQLPLLHDFRQHLAPGRARADLGPQEVPGGEVGVAVLLDNLLTLGALPRAGPACKRPPIQKPRKTGLPQGEDLPRSPSGGGPEPRVQPQAQAPTSACNEPPCFLPDPPALDSPTTKMILVFFSFSVGEKREAELGDPLDQEFKARPRSRPVRGRRQRDGHSSRSCPE